MPDVPDVPDVPAIPDVTVVLPVFNGERTIADELDAVLAQVSDFTFELVTVPLS